MQGDPDEGWRLDSDCPLSDLFYLSFYLDPKSMQNNSPKPPKIAQKAIILHTLRVQVSVYLSTYLLMLACFG